jgi:hypothetical protein
VPETAATEPAAVEPVAVAASTTSAAAPSAAETSAAEERPTRARVGAKKNAKGRRSSVPSWDEIMLGSSRDRD